MKKTALTFFIAIISTLTFAQCIPQSFSGPGFLMPDTSQTLEPVNPLQYYYQEITTYVPVTADINGMQVPIDSAKFESVSGLPPGLSIMLNIPPQRAWHSGTNGCFSIMGESPFSASGFYTASFTFRIFGLGTSALIHLNYRMVVLDSVTAGLNSPVESADDVQVFFSSGEMNIVSKHTTSALVRAYDIQGRLISGQRISLEQGENRVSFDKGRLLRGLVFIIIESPDFIHSQKVFIH